MARSKHLDRWARDADYSDFDTYIRAGNSILDARQDIERRIHALKAALDELDTATVAKPADPAFDKPASDNAHIQGDEA
jgi:hypothetical protein